MTDEQRETRSDDAKKYGAGGSIGALIIFILVSVGVIGPNAEEQLKLDVERWVRLQTQQEQVKDELVEIRNSINEISQTKLVDRIHRSEMQVFRDQLEMQNPEMIVPPLPEFFPQ
jgi:uncharacterized membrane protein (DUF106 family)